MCRVHWLETPISGQSDQSLYRQLALPSGTGSELPRECPRETIGHTACSERSALLQSARENNTSRALFFDLPPPSPSDSPGGAGLRAPDLLTANSNILGFGLLVDASQSAGERHVKTPEFRCLCADFELVLVLRRRIDLVR